MDPLPSEMCVARDLCRLPDVVTYLICTGEPSADQAVPLIEDDFRICSGLNQQTAKDLLLELPFANPDAEPISDARGLDRDTKIRRNPEQTLRV